MHKPLDVRIVCCLFLLRMRVCALLITVLLNACSAPSPPPKTVLQHDPVTEPWYARTVAELAKVNREAKASFQLGKPDAAAALIKKGELLSDRLLSVSKPTLAATEAASDLDDLYGQMLFSNRNYGWARLVFQKNLARWKYWKPPTPEAAIRLNQAKSAIAACDREIGR